MDIVMDGIRTAWLMKGAGLKKKYVLLLLIDKPLKFDEQK